MRHERSHEATLQEAQQAIRDDDEREALLEAFWKQLRQASLCPVEASRAQGHSPARRPLPMRGLVV